MANKSENKNKWLSAIITLLLGFGIVELLMLTTMQYNRLAENEETKLLQDSIIFGGEEYVALGDFLEATSDDMAPNGDESQQSEAQGEEDPQVTGQNDLTNQGAIDEPPRQQVTGNRESPMKVQAQNPKKPQAQTNTNQSSTPQKQNNPSEQAGKQTSSGSATNSRVKNAFGSKNGTGQGAQGSPNGTAGEKAVGQPGVSGLDGYTLEHFPTASCPGPGTVKIRVTVSPTGNVSKATVVGGSLSSNTRARNICLGLARQSRFRVPKGQSVERTGTLIYSVK